MYTCVEFGERRPAQTGRDEQKGIHRSNKAFVVSSRTNNVAIIALNISRPYSTHTQARGRYSSSSSPEKRAVPCRRWALFHVFHYANDQSLGICRRTPIINHFHLAMVLVQQEVRHKRRAALIIFSPDPGSMRSTPPATKRWIEPSTRLTTSIHSLWGTYPSSRTLPTPCFCSTPFSTITRVAGAAGGAPVRRCSCLKNVASSKCT